jgi:predicted Zn-dependent protease
MANQGRKVLTAVYDLHGGSRHLRLSNTIFILLTASVLAACSSGSGRSLLALEDEKTEMRVALAEKIGATPTEVEQALDTTPQQQQQVAVAVAARVIQRQGISEDDAMREHLQGVVDRLASGTNVRRQNFRLVILKSKQANAFTPGAGIILVNEGLLQMVRNEGEVAAVMAHEMAHVLLKHPQRQKQIRLASKAGGAMMDQFTPDGLRDNIGQFLRLGGNATMNGMIRQQELMADAIAIDMLVKANYHPRVMVDVLRSLRGLGTQMNRLNNVIYGNHPLTIDREMVAAKKIKERYYAVSGLRSTPDFDELVKPYHRQRAKRLAQRN